MEDRPELLEEITNIEDIKEALLKYWEENYTIDIVVKSWDRPITVNVHKHPEKDIFYFVYGDKVSTELDASCVLGIRLNKTIKEIPVNVFLDKQNNN